MSPARIVLTAAAVLADILFALRYSAFRKVLPAKCEWQPLCLQWRPNADSAHRSFESLQGEGRMALVKSRLPLVMLFAFTLTLAVATCNMAKIPWMLSAMLVSCTLGSICLHAEAALNVRACAVHPGGEKQLRLAAVFAWGKWVGFAVWLALFFFCIVSSASKL